MSRLCTFSSVSALFALSLLVSSCDNSTINNLEKTVKPVINQGNTQVNSNSLIETLEKQVKTKYGLVAKASGKDITKISDIENMSDAKNNLYFVTYGTMNTPIVYKIGERYNLVPTLTTGESGYVRSSLFPSKDVLVRANNETIFHPAYTLRTYIEYYDSRVLTKLNELKK